MVENVVFSKELDNTILKGPVQPFTRAHNFNRVPYDQPSNLLPDRQHPGDLNQRGWQDRTTCSQWFQDFQISLSGHPCCSSYRLVSSLAQSKPMVHMLDVWLQCRQVRGRCDRSTLDLENVLVILSHHLVGQLAMAGVPRRSTNVSVHQLYKLLQLFHHTSLDIPVVTYLPKCFVEPGIPLQLLFLWPHFSLAFEGAGVIIWKYSSRGEWHSSLLSETQPGEIILCWESLCASLILCPGIQSTWLNGHGEVELFTNVSASGGSEHSVFRS